MKQQLKIQITGPAGSGKSTVLRIIQEAFAANNIKVFSVERRLDGQEGGADDYSRHALSRQWVSVKTNSGEIELSIQEVETRPLPACFPGDKDPRQGEPELPILPEESQE